MTFYMLVMTIIIFIWLVSILIAEYYVGIADAFKDLVEDAKTQEGVDEVPEKLLPFIVGVVLFAMMPVIAFNLITKR